MGAIEDSLGEGLLTHDTKVVRLAVSLSHIGAMPGAAGLATLLDLAVTADEAGVDQIVLSEHVVLPAVIDGHPGVGPVLKEAVAALPDGH